MTDARKQIIEIIEPYMLQDFAAWLYYKKRNWDIQIVWDVWVFNDKLENENNWKLVTNHWLWTKTLDNMKEWGWQILWHYDTTALLKYIDEIGCWHIFTQKEIFTDEIRIFTKDQYELWKVTAFWDNLWWLPCKPLHLYTDQEDQTTLLILREIEKLWN